MPAYRRIAPILWLACALMPGGDRAVAQPRPGRAAAERRTQREIRWLGAYPRVPLAVVPLTPADEGPASLESIGVGPISSSVASEAAWEAATHACRSWAPVGSTWLAVDRYGQPVGETRVTERREPPVAGCDWPLLELDGPAGEPGIHYRAGRAALAVSGPWQPRASYEWVPAESVHQEHLRFLNALYPLVLRPRTAEQAASRCSPDVPRVRDRTLFFQFDGANGVRQLAVTGGRVLVVAERTPSGTWFASFVENGLDGGMPNDFAYQPVAVLDLDQDNDPEIVFHHAEMCGHIAGDVALTLGSNDDWYPIAYSVGASI